MDSFLKDIFEQSLWSMYLSRQEIEMCLGLPKSLQLIALNNLTLSKIFCGGKS